MDITDPHILNRQKKRPLPAQQTCTCSKAKIETLEKCVKCV